MKCTFYRLIQLKYSNLLWMISITVSFFSEYQQIILCISNKELLCFIKIHIIIIYNNYYSAGNSPYTKTKAHSTNNSPFIKSGRNKSKKQEWEDRIPKLSNFCMTLYSSPLICHVFAKIQSYSKPKNTIFLAFFLYYY